MASFETKFESPFCVSDIDYYTFSKNLNLSQKLFTIHLITTNSAQVGVATMPFTLPKPYTTASRQICVHCAGDFNAKGYASHVKACERRAKATERELLHMNRVALENASTDTATENREYLGLPYCDVVQSF